MYSVINLLYLIITTLSFLHSFTFFDYNLPLFLTITYLWNKSKKERLQIFLLIISSLLIDFIYILYFSISYQIKFSLKIYKMDSWSQKIWVYRIFRFSFSLNMVVKVLILVLVVVTNVEIRQKLKFDFMVDRFLKFFFLK